MRKNWWVKVEGGIQFRGLCEEWVQSLVEGGEEERQIQRQKRKEEDVCTYGRGLVLYAAQILCISFLLVQI